MDTLRESQATPFMSPCTSYRHKVKAAEIKQADCRQLKPYDTVVIFGMNGDGPRVEAFRGVTRYDRLRAAALSSGVSSKSTMGSSEKLESDSTDQRWAIT